MDPITGTFVVNDLDNDDFAELSGDFNPLHVDATYARRLQFGSAVVHGVHHLLRALDQSFSQSTQFLASCIHGIDVSFPSPVRPNQVVEYTLRFASDGESADLTGMCEGRRVLAATVNLAQPLTPVNESSVVSDDPPAACVAC